ncbi:MAG: TIGR03087 family PEP-CTERM/XrtA system glycosyltransferase [Alphaproteobacteria bacterium]
MSDLLFLVQRIPYPPTKGEKIRHYRFLRHLAGRFRVHLGCFVDDPLDWDGVETLRALCADTHFAPLDRRRARVTCLRGLLTGAPLTTTYFQSRRLQAWVDRVLRETRPQVAVMCSSMMARFVLGRVLRPPRLVMDFCDVDAEKWRAYADSAPWPASAVYRREGRRLLDFDRGVARAVEASVFVSEPEAALFRHLAPESADRVTAVANGVDFDFFSPERAYPVPDDAPPSDATGPAFVFTGTMDYRPNVEAVVWFAHEVMPLIRQRVPAARFVIVGASPAPAVRALDRLPGVTVTGRVADVRPYLAHAQAAVAPLFIARGLQNKVLEAMAMARPVIVSPQALEGIDAEPGREVLLATDAATFAEEACRLALMGDSHDIGGAARRKILASWAWPARLAALDRIVDGTWPAAHAGCPRRIA